MSLWFPLCASLLIGVAFSQQPVINASVARLLGSPVAAAAISVFITFCCLLVMVPFSGGTVRLSVLLTLPWWTVLSGLIGVALVAGGAALIPLTGAAVFFVCMVAGQLLGASIADHVGAFGLPVHTLSVKRFLGLVLVVVGAVLVHRG
ncbi:MAG: DMT family transporter [Granulosicoccus sp.]